MKTQVISFHCILKNSLGQLISSSYNREVINGASGDSETLVDLAGGLQNVGPGDKRQIKIRAERAYGFYDCDLSAEIPRSELSNGHKLKVGDSIRMRSIDDDERELNFRVTHATKHTVIVDGNHPLAGQDLIFDIDVTDVREIDCDQDGFTSLTHAAGTCYH